MKLFNLSLLLNGFKIKEAIVAFNKSKNISESDFYNYVETQKKTIVSYHLQHNPFYKSFAKNASLDDWNSIPVMTKRDLQQPLNNRLSEGFNDNNSYVNKTSGSSGDPFIFAKDKWSHALTWAENMDRYAWYDIDLNSSKQARFYGIPLDKKGYYKERFKDWLGNRYRFSVFDLSNEALEKCLVKFKKSKFHYINGYTSPIVQFAKFLEAKNVILKSVCPSLKVCIVTSEMLYEDDRKLMEKQFGIPIINEYGASELGLIAFQNKEGDLQLNSENLYTEILDENNEVLPYGEEGKIVITSLYNKAHPFIRYEIGDVGVLSKKSTAKKPILEKIVGRTNDIAILPSGKKAAGLTFYYVTKTVIEDESNVKEFVIEQLKLDSFLITYVSDKALTANQEKDIVKAMETYLEEGISVDFKKLDVLKRSKSGKLKQFISHL